MRILDNGTVHDAREAPRHLRFCTFPSLVRLEDGRLACAFRTGSSKDSPDEDVRVMGSGDGGSTWQLLFEGFGDYPRSPSPLQESSHRETLAGRFRGLSITAAGGTRLLGAALWVDHSDPSLPLFDPDTEGVLPTRIYYLESPDGGRSWDMRGQVPLAPHTGNATTGSILMLRDGTLALPYEAWKEYGDRSPGKHHAALRLSHDGGATWPELAVVAHDPEGRTFFWDQRLDIDPDSGELVAMFWTHDRLAGRDLDMHIAWGSPDARQWETPASTGIAGQICAPLPLGGGRLFAAYVHRHDPPGMRALFSADRGRTWDREGELTLFEQRQGRESGMGGQRDFADYWADMSRWTFGHPAAIALADSSVMVVFYGGDSKQMGIHWVRIGLD